MSKVTPIKDRYPVYSLLDPLADHNHIAATVTPEGNFLISQPSHQVLLTREQAEFVLPHLQRWLEEK